VVAMARGQNLLVALAWKPRSGDLLDPLCQTSPGALGLPDGGCHGRKAVGHPAARRARACRGTRGFTGTASGGKHASSFPHVSVISG